MVMSIITKYVILVKEWRIDMVLASQKNVYFLNRFMSRVSLSLSAKSFLCFSRSS